MKAKDINLCDLINVLAWDRPIRLKERSTEKTLFKGIAYKVPDNFLGYEVWEVSTDKEYIEIEVKEVKR